MRHGSVIRKFGRTNKQRAAFLRGLMASLIARNKITTTQARAKSLRVEIEKLITKSKNPSLTTTRLLVARLGQAPAKKLLTDIGPKFKDRHGGYTRIRNLAPRVSDGARMAIIEFIE